LLSIPQLSPKEKSIRSPTTGSPSKSTISINNFVEHPAGESEGEIQPLTNHRLSLEISLIYQHFC
jgi:hypothetical protein